jgi:diacylglycerol kinase (ATP)
VRKILLLVNPLFESHTGRYLSRIQRVFQDAGVEVETSDTGASRAASTRAKHAIEQGMDAVIVCGGDGTIFDTLQGLAGSNVPLGICPFGTGNILAQNLDMPQDPVQAARWLLTAQPRTIPLGKITCCTLSGKQTWYFASAAGMGPHAAMMEVAHRSDKDRTGRSAYFTAGFKLLISHPIQPFDLTITTVEGETLQRTASELIAVRVSKLNIWRPGGGLDLPFLRLATVEGTSRLRLAQASFQALLLQAGSRNGHNGNHGAARYEDIRQVVCRPILNMKYEPPIAVEADGEILGASCATIEMADVSLNVLAGPPPIHAS